MRFLIGKIIEKIIDTVVGWMVSSMWFKLFLKIALTTLLEFFHQSMIMTSKINWYFLVICFVIDFYFVSFYITKSIESIKESGVEEPDAVNFALNNEELFSLIDESLRIVENHAKVREERDLANDLLLEICIPDPTPYELEERAKVQISKVQEVIRKRVREFYGSKTWLSSKTFDLFIKKEIQHQKEQNDKLRLKTWGVS